MEKFKSKCLCLTPCEKFHDISLQWPLISILILPWFVTTDLSCSLCLSQSLLFGYCFQFSFLDQPTHSVPIHNLCQNEKRHHIKQANFVQFMFQYFQWIARYLTFWPWSVTLNIQYIVIWICFLTWPRTKFLSLIDKMIGCIPKLKKMQKWN